MEITFYHTKDGQPSDKARNLLVSEQTMSFHGGTSDGETSKTPLLMTARF